MRLTRSLAGQWLFQLDPHGQLSPESLEPDRQITVPLPWQAAFPDLANYSGYAWYQYQFNLDQEWLGGELLLHFGAVDYWCQVYVNDQFVAEHEGGFTPFDLPIRKYVQMGPNVLTVRVYDSAQDSIIVPRWFDQNTSPSTQPPFDARLLPHGKQEWYFNVGGIWQDVTLTSVPASYIQQVHITPNIHTGIAEIKVEIVGEPQVASLSVEIDDNHATIPVTSGQSTYTLSVPLNNPRLWTPESPHLYTANVTLSDGEQADSVSERFGFREVQVKNGQLLLNGEPIILLSALDQDFYPQTIYTVPSDDFLRDQFRKAKELGLNSLRCHIKVPDPRYLDLADEMGLLIWEEIPSWRTFHPKNTVNPNALHLEDAVKNRVRTTLQAMIARDYNHPSLIIYSIVNEDWGTGLFLSESDRAWLIDMVDFGKSLDPTRLIVDNSPCPASWGLSIHVKTDIDDFHVYTNIPDSADYFEQFVEQFAQRPTWTFATDGTAQRTGHEPLILSEFGNWGLPVLRNIAPNGEPDWFSLGPWWSSWDGEPGYPQGVVSRFKQLGLDTIWQDYDTFAEATQWHQYHALKFEIETLRRQPSIMGYVITELSDIYWESNGLLDFERCPKVYHDVFKTINSPDAVIPKLKRYAYWDDETVHAQLHIARYGTDEWKNAQIETQLADSHIHEAVPPIQRGDVIPLGSKTWQLPSVEQTSILSLSLKVVGENREIAKNDTPILILPAAARAATFTGNVTIALRPGRAQNDFSENTENGPLSPALQAFSELGYQVSSGLTSDTQLLITDHPTSDMLDWVRGGGDMLFLSGGTSPFFWSHGRGGAYSGNWMTSFNWLRPNIYRRLDVTNPLSLPFIDATPHHVILGLPMDNPDFHLDILAGQITGWVGHPAAHTAQFRYGQGRVIMTTYPLAGKFYHPVLVAMLHDLVDHLTSDSCQPVLKV